MLKVDKKTIGIFILCIISSVFLMCSYSGTPGYALLPLLPISFGIMVLLSGNMLQRCLKNNFGVTIVLALLFFKSVVFPVFFQLGKYADEFGLNLSNKMPIAILISVYEIVSIFLIFLILDNHRRTYKKRILMKEEKGSDNYQGITFWVIVLMILFIATFLLEPNCFKFYLNLSNITDPNFSNNEMSAVINQYSNGFFSKFIMVLHNYLTRIIRFLVPLHIIMSIYRKNNRTSGYLLCLCVSVLNIFIIDGTISRGLVYAFILMLLSCIIYKKENHIYRIAIITVIALILYFYIRAVILSRVTDGIWEYLSRYIGSYFSSIANTAATLQVELTRKELNKFILYDYLESIPFGNTLFGLDNISFQKIFNSVNACYGQIPTTIGTSCLYFGYFLAPLYSIVFSQVAYKAGIIAQQTTSVFKKGILFLLAFHCAMAITMYYIKIVMVVFIGLIIPLLLIGKIVQKHSKITCRNIE